MNKGLFGLLLALVFAPPAFAHTQAYSLTPLDGLEGGSWSSVAAINNLGQAAGSANLADGSYHGVLFTTEGTRDLGTFPGGTASAAFGINAGAAVVGVAYLPNNLGHRAFLYSDGELHDLGTLAFNSPPAQNDSGENIATAGNSGAVSVNDSGDVVGTSDVLGGGHHAVLWSNGTLIDLGTLGGSSSDAQAINNSGQIAGGAHTVDDVVRPYLYTPGQGLRDLGTLPGGTSGIANALNEAGDVAGWSTTAGGARHAFLYRDGVMLDLGVLAGIPATEALAINSAGDVVGSARSGTSYRRSLKAFIYSAGKLEVLNALIPANSGWILTEARDINDAGQIVAMGQLNGGPVRAVLLSPQ